MFEEGRGQTQLLVNRVAWLYVVIVLTWTMVYFLAGDRIIYFEFINALAVYFFAPLPWLFFQSWMHKSWRLGIGCALMTGVFLTLWGPLFIPKTHRWNDERLTLAVMTYNLQGSAGDVADSIAAIQAEDADVVLLQEVTYEVAYAIQEKLANEYPWQYLDPRNYASGMGILSTLPLTVVPFEWADRWNGWPQMVQVQMGGAAITLINVHLHASIPARPSLVEQAAANREHNAITLTDIVSQVSSEGPVILAGDFNVSQLSTVYKIITTQLGDAWWEAGTGFGHTFPADAEPPGWLAWKHGLPIPQKLVRIDYIFHSWDLIPRDAHRGVNLGGSDHQSVVTIFELAD